MMAYCEHCGSKTFGDSELCGRACGEHFHYFWLDWAERESSERSRRRHRARAARWGSPDRSLVATAQDGAVPARWRTDLLIAWWQRQDWLDPDLLLTYALTLLPFILGALSSLLLR